MIGSEGLEGQSRDQMQPKNGELGWLSREAREQKRLVHSATALFQIGLQTIVCSLRKSHAVSQIGNIKSKVR